MRSSTRILSALNIFVGTSVLALGAWMPDEKILRVPLWLMIALLTGMLLDR